MRRAGPKAARAQARPDAAGVALGAVIVAYGNHAGAARLAESLLDLAAPAGVVVVQNPTGPDDTPMAQPAPGVGVIRMPRNVGYAAAMNTGLRALLERPYTHFLLLTQDASLEPGAAAALVEHAAGGSIGVTAPVLANSDTGLDWSYGGRTDRRGQVSHIREPVGGGPLVEVDWVDGSCMVVARRLLEEIGLFDESFFMYFEETDLCLRARRAGWQVVVALDARGFQAPGRGRRTGAYEYLLTRNGAEFARRVGGWRAVLTSIRAAADRWRSLAGEGWAPGATLRSGEGRAKLLGISLGVAAFLVRSWGPPPAWLPGIGDIRYTGRPAGRREP